MAGLKKPSKKRDDNPNTALVLFLVFFVILSIGLGVWGYFGYAGQDELRKKTKDEKAATTAARLGEEYNRFIALDARLALGHALDPEDLKSWEASSKDKVLDDTGKFKDEKTRAAIKKMMDDNKAELGSDAAGKYATSYRDKLTKLTADMKKAQADYLAAEAKSKEAKENLDSYAAKFEGFRKKALGDINNGNAASLKAALEKTEEMKESFRRNQDLQNQLAKINEEHQGAIAKLNGEKNILLADLKKAKDAAAANTNFTVRDRSEAHALLLDISKGKTLWDDPLGKIIKVDSKEKLVVINIGSAHGAKPELTFNVFGASWKKRAEGLFKGTIEVIRVLDGSTSVARITSLYDATGAEIPLNDPNKGRTQREADNALKEGDLIFNLTFGTHAVLAGNFNWSGFASDSPAEQMRNMKDFMHLLQRQGVTVDAYLDLTDGKLKGDITSKTRFFIRGDSLLKSADAERAKMINDRILEVRREAIERGMFMISADNLANVIGYRRPRSASDLEVSGFRPALPAAPEVP